MGHAVTVTTVGATLLTATTLLPFTVVALPMYPGFGVSAAFPKTGSII